MYATRCKSRVNSLHTHTHTHTRTHTQMALLSILKMYCNLLRHLMRVRMFNESVFDIHSVKMQLHLYLDFY